MNIKESIETFAEQFGWRPKVLRASQLKQYDHVIVCGMGGSHLAADLLTLIKPDMRLTVWSDYGLPPIAKRDAKRTLVIASSYSGNTEEVIDAFRAAGKLGTARAVLAAGGKLIPLATRERVPMVRMPDLGIQPRSALGLNLKGLLALLDEETLLRNATSLSRTLKPTRYKSEGKKLARMLRGKVPLIYSSRRNQSIAYNWKIKFNETGKIPAFSNVVPELNHNEMTGFDVTPKSRKLSKNLYVIFLTDRSDDPRISKRMRILVRLYRARGLSIKEIPLRGGTVLSKIFSSLLVADWAAYHIALLYGANPTEVPMVEEFKHLIR